mgnify:CR=1 FL=1|tara:strand:+ start:3164 stop:4675 length:1512 start_codon:yes stop_codon:yes gene_type:complete
MSASVTQLIATTAVDTFLTSGSTASFWLNTPATYAVFAIDHREVQTEAYSTCLSGKTFTIDRVGDYIKSCILKIVGPGLKNMADTSNAVVLPGQAPGRSVTAGHYEASGGAGAADTALGHVVKTVSPNVNAINNEADISARYANFFPCCCVSSAKWNVGSNTVDELQSEDVQLFYECFASLVPKRSLNCGSKAERTRMAMHDECVWFVDLPFFFSVNPGACFSLIGATFSNLQLKLTLVDPTTLIENYSKNSKITALTLGDGSAQRAVNTMKYTATASSSSANQPAVADYSVTLILGYVFVGTDERNARLNASEDVLIIQHQQMTPSTTSAIAPATANTAGPVSFNMSFEHNFPVACQMLLPAWSARKDYGEGNCYYGDVDANHRSAACPEGLPHHLLDNIDLSFNNNSRQEAMPSLFYTELQHMMHSAKVPDMNHVYMYSYGLQHPYTGAASGSANYSRIDSIKATGTLNHPGYGTVQIKSSVISYNLISFSGGTLIIRFAS